MWKLWEKPFLYLYRVAKNLQVSPYFIVHETETRRRREQMQQWQVCRSFALSRIDKQRGSEGFSKYRDEPRRNEI